MNCLNEIKPLRTLFAVWYNFVASKAEENSERGGDESYGAGLCNGSTDAFGASSQGSNPCPAAQRIDKNPIFPDSSTVERVLLVEGLTARL